MNVLLELGVVRRAGAGAHCVGEEEMGRRVERHVRHVPEGEEQLEQLGSHATSYSVQSGFTK